MAWQRTLQLDLYSALKIRFFMSEWYFSKNGQQEGPVTQQQIEALVRAGQLDPAVTHVWHEGLANWQTFEESGLIVETAAIPSPRVAPSAGGSPYLAPREPIYSTVRQGYEVEAQYPGYGRLRFFLTLMAVTVVLYAIMFIAIFAAFSGGAEGGAGAAISVTVILLMLGMVAGSLYIYRQRVINLGMSGWAVLWTFVPFLNIWIGWRMIACPAGYEHHRTLDTAGKVISGIFIGFFALAIIANILAAFLQS